LHTLPLGGEVRKSNELQGHDQGKHVYLKKPSREGGDHGRGKKIGGVCRGGGEGGGVRCMKGTTKRELPTQWEKSGEGRKRGGSCGNRNAG